MKIYHAHGFVVRNNFPVEGEEIWNSDSSFSKVFGDFESARSYILDCFECSSDEAEGAGEKFKAGDIVRLTDWEDERGRDLFVVYKTPRPAEEGAIWQNHYTVLGVGLYGSMPAVSEEEFHEADLALCSQKDLEYYPYREQLLSLQNVIMGKVVLPEEIWNKILSGRIIFNTDPSWRDISELFRKNSGK